MEYTIEIYTPQKEFFSARKLEIEDAATSREILEFYAKKYDLNIREYDHYGIVVNGGFSLRLRKH